MGSNASLAPLSKTIAEQFTTFSVSVLYRCFICLFINVVYSVLFTSFIVLLWWGWIPWGVTWCQKKHHNLNPNLTLTDIKYRCKWDDSLILIYLSVYYQCLILYSCCFSYVLVLLSLCSCIIIPGCNLCIHFIIMYMSSFIFGYLFNYLFLLSFYNVLLIF